MNGPELDELLESTLHLPNGDEKVSILEQAVRAADLHADLDGGFQARQMLINAAIFSGQEEKSLIALAWCLARFDAHPERFLHEELLWNYKLVAGQAIGFPQIPLAKLQAMIEDLEARARRYGVGARTIHYQRMRLAQHRGLRDEAGEHHASWIASGRDWLSDCPACETDRNVTFHVFMGEDEQAVHAAEPILSGEQRCTEIPHITYAHLLLPLLRLGRGDEARRMHEAGYRLIRGNRNFLSNVGDHLAYLALTGELDAAVAMFARHAPWIVESAHQTARFECLLGAVLLFDRLRARGVQVLRVSLPAGIPVAADGGAYAVSLLGEWVDGTARDLATAFDTRNGTPRFHDRLASVRALAGRIA